MTAPTPEQMRDESAATCGACGTNVWIRDDHWWIDNRGRSGFRVLDAWHQHKPLYADLPANAPDDEL